jgi:hypothetical protein
MLKIARQDTTGCKVYVFDFDETVTINGTNSSFINFGIDYICNDEQLAKEASSQDSDENKIDFLVDNCQFSRIEAERIVAEKQAITAQLLTLNRLRPNTAEAFSKIIKNGNKIVIATNHVFPEVINYHLRAILSEEEIAQHVVLKTAPPSCLVASGDMRASALIENGTLTKLIHELNDPEVSPQHKKDLLDNVYTSNDISLRGKELVRILRYPKNQMIRDAISEIAADTATASISHVYFFDDRAPNIADFLAGHDLANAQEMTVMARHVNSDTGEINDLNQQDLFVPLMDSVITNEASSLEDKNSQTTSIDANNSHAFFKLSDDDSLASQASSINGASTARERLSRSLEASSEFTSRQLLTTSV